MSNENGSHDLWKRFREWNPSFGVRLAIVAGALAVAAGIYILFPDLPSSVMRLISVICIALAAVTSIGGSPRGRSYDEASSVVGPVRPVATRATELFPHPPYPRLWTGLVSLLAYPAIVAMIPFVAGYRQDDPLCVALVVVCVAAGLCGLWFAIFFFKALLSDKTSAQAVTEHDGRQMRAKTRLWAIMGVLSTISALFAPLAVFLMVV